MTAQKRPVHWTSHLNVLKAEKRVKTRWLSRAFAMKPSGFGARWREWANRFARGTTFLDLPSDGAQAGAMGNGKRYGIRTSSDEADTCPVEALPMPLGSALPPGESPSHRSGTMRWSPKAVPGHFNRNY